MNYNYESAESSKIGFEVGEKIIVERSNGKQEVWKVGNASDGKVLVSTKEGDKILSKTVDESALEGLNSPVKSDEGWVDVMTKSKHHFHTPQMVRGAINAYKQLAGLAEDYELNVNEFRSGVIGNERIHETTNEMLRVLQSRFEKM